MIPGSAITGAYRKPAGLDPFFANVTLLMHFDGNLTEVTGKTVNVTAGSAGYSTAPTGFGQDFVSSGTNSLTLSATDSGFDYGTGDFTIEARIKLASVSGSQVIVTVGAAGSYNYVFYHAGGQLRWYAAGADRITGGSMGTGTVHSVAIARVAGTSRLFIDGVQVGSNYADSNSYTTGGSALQIIHQDNAARLDGTLDELRITKGVGRRSGTYTPDTAPFPNS